MHADTIVALATPPGEGGVAIVRLSGPHALTIGRTLFTGRLRDHRVSYGAVRDPAGGEPIDEALALYMAAPRSLTREDVVELHLHGGTISVRRVLDLALQQGARAAEPGEFTLRAFLNGRIDLAQAEAVLDVVRSRTGAAQRAAVAGLTGALSDRIKAVRDSLLAVLAYLVARIDFPDEDVPEQDIRHLLHDAAASLDRLLATARAGALLRDGARVALIGPPNAGKSSLLNRLLGHDRAIVTPVAGTTRDTLEESANIGGIPVVLTDTAGISDAPDPIEAIGIERSHKAAATADTLLLVLDASRAPDRAALEAILALAQDRPALIALNKSDLPQRIDAAALPLPAIPISALTGDGIDALTQRLAQLLTRDAPLHGDVLLTNARHAEALRLARTSIADALSGLGAGLPEDFISTDLRAALEAIGLVTGETASEDLLGEIFRRFCIGK